MTCHDRLLARNGSRNSLLEAHAQSEARPHSTWCCSVSEPVQHTKWETLGVCSRAEQPGISTKQLYLWVSLTCMWPEIPSISLRGRVNKLYKASSQRVFNREPLSSLLSLPLHCSSSSAVPNTRLHREKSIPVTTSDSPSVTGCFQLIRALKTKLCISNRQPQSLGDRTNILIML